jgi:hypothetical protein
MTARRRRSWIDEKKLVAEFKQALHQADAEGSDAVLFFARDKRRKIHAEGRYDVKTWIVGTALDVTLAAQALIGALLIPAGSMLPDAVGWLRSTFVSLQQIAFEFEDVQKAALAARRKKTPVEGMLGDPSTVKIEPKDAPRRPITESMN